MRPTGQAAHGGPRPPFQTPSPGRPTIPGGRIPERRRIRDLLSRFGWMHPFPADKPGFDQPGLVDRFRATVRAKIPSVARSAPSDITGKIPAVFQVSSISDQS